MSLLSRVRNFLALPYTRKKLLFEAVTALLHAKRLVERKPFSSYSASLGKVYQGEFGELLDCEVTPQPLGQVRWALQRVNRLAGGRYTCLMMAIAGKRLLNKRGLANTLVLGVNPRKGDGADPFGAHAWLRAGQYVVIGMEERDGHIPVASYHSEPRR